MNEAAATPPATTVGTGQGLIGLDERVRLAGGWLAAGPQPAGGWRVTAVLPADRPARAPDSFDVTFSRRITRRRLAQTAVLPLGIVLALVSTLTVAQVLEVSRTGLADDRYRTFSVGEPESQIRAQLPSRTADGPIRLVAETPPPTGSRCSYYHAGAALTDLAPQVYRLCFAGGVLVAKNRFERA